MDTTTPRTPRHSRSLWTIIGAFVALLMVPVLLVAGYAGYLALSGTPLIDEWICGREEAPVDMAEGGSYCETPGTDLPAGHTWHPLGNRPMECTDRWGWHRVYTTWETSDPDDRGYEIGCLRNEADLPAGWTPVPADADEVFVPEGANPAFAH